MLLFCQAVAHMHEMFCVLSSVFPGCFLNALNFMCQLSVLLCCSSYTLNVWCYFDVLSGCSLYALNNWRHYAGFATM